MSSEGRRPLHLPVPLQRFPPPPKRRRPGRRGRRRAQIARGSLMLLGGAAILAMVGVAARRLGGLSRLRQAGGAVYEGIVQLLPGLLELGLLLALALLVPAALLLLIGGVVRIVRALRRGSRR